MKQQGMILISTLLMISVLALIVLSQMQLIFLQFKAMSDTISRHRSFRQLEATAYQLVAERKRVKKECVVPEANDYRLIERLKNKKGCALTIHNEHYQYLMEDLGVYPCMETFINSQRYTTKHTRLTVALLLDKPLILQLRTANVGKYRVCEGNQPVIVKPGILSWRYLS
jgi:hypothetical protein